MCAYKILIFIENNLYLFEHTIISYDVSKLSYFRRARSEFFYGNGGEYRECFEVSRSMIEFVLVDSPNCPDAGDGRNPWNYLAIRPESCACDLVRSRSRHRNPGKKDNRVSLISSDREKASFFLSTNISAT